MQSWVKVTIGIIGFFGIILGYVSQVTHLSGHLDLAGIIKNGLLLGALIGGILGFALHQKGKDQDARFSIYSGMLVLGLATGPLLLTTINRLLSTTPHTVEFELVSLKPVMGSRGGVIEGKKFKADAHLLKVKKEDIIYELQLGPDLENYLIDDDSIILNIRKGGVGYDYVDHSPTSEVM